MRLWIKGVSKVKPMKQAIKIVNLFKPLAQHPFGHSAVHCLPVGMDTFELVLLIGLRSLWLAGRPLCSCFSFLFFFLGKGFRVQEKEVNY